MEDQLSLLGESGRDVTREQREFMSNQVEELKRSNAALLAEIDLYEQFIGHMEPQDLGSHAEVEGEQGHGLRQRSNPQHYPQQLTLEQKLYVAQKEVTEAKLDQERHRLRHERIEDGYKASLEEAELCLVKIWRARNIFERRVRKAMQDNWLEPEKVLHYIKDKSAAAQLEKLKLYNQTLKAREKKLQQQLQPREEPINTEFEDISKKFKETKMNKTLDELQVINQRAQCVLSSTKEKLQCVTCTNTELSTDINSRKQMLVKIEGELQHAEEERLKAEALNKHLRRQMADYQAPDITQYMHAKEKHKKLRQSVHTWERKVRIAEMAMKTNSKAWSAQRVSLTTTHRAGAGGNPIPGKLPYLAQHR